MLGTTKGFNPSASPCFSLVDSSILILSYSTHLMMSSFFSLDLLLQPCSGATRYGKIGANSERSGTVLLCLCLQRHTAAGSIVHSYAFHSCPDTAIQMDMGDYPFCWPDDRRLVPQAS